MQFSNVAISALSLASMAGLVSGQSSASKYSYKPGGETFGGKFLPGPGQWGGQCNDGSTEQSPIAIDTNMWAADADVHVDDYTFLPGTCAFNQLIYSVEDNGVKVSFDATSCVPPSVRLPEDPSAVSIGLGNLGLGVGTREVYGPESGKLYSALQFHIHSSSEHTIDGNSFKAEMHIVHAQQGTFEPAILDVFEGVPIAGDLLVGMDDSRGATVIGYMIDDLAPSGNVAFENLLKGFESVSCGGEGPAGASVVSSGLFDPYDFLDETSCIMNYDGSLTTPDCNEIVEWNLAMKPFSISESQMTRLLALINDCPESISHNGSTSRPVQPLNGRTVNHICPSSSVSV